MYLYNDRPNKNIYSITAEHFLHYFALPPLSLPIRLSLCFFSLFYSLTVCLYLFLHSLSLSLSLYNTTYQWVDKLRCVTIERFMNFIFWLYAVLKAGRVDQWEWEGGRERGTDRNRTVRDRHKGRYKDRRNGWKEDRQLFQQLIFL